MPSTDPLVMFEEPDGLRQPILIMAFSGWNDAAESATTAARFLGQLWPSRALASIDSEEFYHFGLSRPYVRFKAESSNEREIVWPSTDFSVSRIPSIDRDLIVGVAIEPHLKWRTYCGAVLELARRSQASLLLTLGALLAEVPHTRPVRLSGSAPDPELAAVLGIRPSRYEGPTGIVGVLNTLCREEGVPTASLWANVPHYVSGVENPKAALALVRRVLSLLGAEADLSELVEATRQFEGNLNEVVGQNAKIAEYVKTLEGKQPDDEEAAGPVPGAGDELPPSADLVAEIEQFLRQQRPESS
jgi:proteasome assembly chaperone (PAC2) family protein